MMRLASLPTVPPVGNSAVSTHRASAAAASDSAGAIPSLRPDLVDRNQAFAASRVALALASALRYAAPSSPERQVGVEVGLNLGVILGALAPHRRTWRGFAAHFVTDNLRVLHLVGGLRYDLNGHDSRGPDAANGCHEC